MTQPHSRLIANELNVSAAQVDATVELLDGGATVPFISRYRKEATGSLDEVFVAAIRDRIGQLRELDKRRQAILKSLREQGKATAELEAKIGQASTMAVLEDLYLPFKPKRRTRAAVARERGLAPLAEKIFGQTSFAVAAEAARFVDAERDVNSPEEALAGARDIVAEWVNENPDARAALRNLFWKKGRLKTRVIAGQEAAAQKFKDYFEWEEPLAPAPSHRVLAMRRGEKEGFLTLDVAPPEEDALAELENRFVAARNEAAGQVKLAVKDAYKRLLQPSIETEIRLAAKQKADQEAIRVFAENLRGLLLAAPLGQKNVLALDPGFRSGCKLVVLNRQGKLLHEEVIYPHEPQRQLAKAGTTVRELCTRFGVEAISIGNGTAGRETESFVQSLSLPPSIPVVMVNESGASVYSASEVARAEFPDRDLTVRGAVSIGRRLMDPLAELVKIDPKSIGVGQYQHDVDQPALQQSLDDVVASCVNAVGVEVNTASQPLLTYVSGLGPQLAQNIVDYRNENGPFESRAALRKVPRLGDKAFEQAAGFLRIRDARNPLDRSAVHPERYEIVRAMARDLGCSVEELIGNESRRGQIQPRHYVTEDVGLPTLTDILGELAKPGRDPRAAFEAFRFDEGVSGVEDLRVGMSLPGIVTNVTAFGAFVDVGVHQDGLVHISELSDRFVKDPKEVVKVQQRVRVRVLEVDIARKRIALSMKSEGAARPAEPLSPPKSKKTEANPEEERDATQLKAKLDQLKGKFGR
ncbi:MAG: RNA-binding transcriptional accessory protein [Ferruginibacter sp.]|nr:RNA-binding transcriptional accessory protein [Cytophagales bacterium]